MCGIFGAIKPENTKINLATYQNILDKLFVLSESRGKEASGVAVMAGDKISVYKQALPASDLVKKNEYRELIKKSFSQAGNLAAIGHARLVTNGVQTSAGNNQPVVKNGIIIIHNGIVTNVEALWNKYKDLKREYEVDTEIIPALLHKFLNEGSNIKTAIKRIFTLVEGTISIAVFFVDYDYLMLASNNGSLYVVINKQAENVFCTFASERYILEKLIEKTNEFESGSSVITQIKPNEVRLVNLKNCQMDNSDLEKRNTPLDYLDLTPMQRENKSEQKIFEVPKEFLDNFKRAENKVDELKRCRKCLLTETMPFIGFNEEGVCNYCENYKKIELEPLEELKRIADKYRQNDGQPDCLVPLSGGRDSSYTLHYIKKVLKMNPVAFSYDWGMITDLARRNQARMCGALGVEHIIVSADIDKKRKNIGKNVLAWLKKPDLGIVTLFMAGDKQYFYYLNKVKKQLGVELVVYGENPLEKTDFKYGFCGLKPLFGLKHAYNQGVGNKFKIAWYYLKQFLKNPTYLNSSLLDTAGAFLSSYFISHKHLFLFHYLKWDEQEIEKVLLTEYNWELSPDTKTSWRIGDGTAAFYNYIYYVMAGFTENDTFRSNQVREKYIDRKRALELVWRDNQPRWPSIKWYCDTINIDFNKAIEKINSAKKKF